MIAESVIGRISGRITRRKMRPSLAPSTRAASRSSSGMARSPARNIAMQKPLICQAAAMTSPYSAVRVSASQGDFKKSRWTSSSSRLIPKLGLKIHRQTVPVTTNEMASGKRKMF